MKWHDATKVLPAASEIVLVKDGDIEFRYVLCQLFGDGFDICFLPYEEGQDCIEIKEGVLWARIELPG